MVRACHECQASKIGRHTKALLSHFDPPDRGFGDIHVDLVGPLPSSEDCNYLLTIVDRFTRWPEAIPLPNAEAVTCAKALLRTWITRFGVPNTIISDQGRQFTSSLWRELNMVLGVKPQTTTAYHPQANGMVERFHRSLDGPRWMDELPIVMLGIRTTWKETLMLLLFFSPMAQTSECLAISFHPHVQTRCSHPVRLSKNCKKN